MLDNVDGTEMTVYNRVTVLAVSLCMTYQSGRERGRKGGRESRIGEDDWVYNAAVSNVAVVHDSASSLPLAVSKISVNDASGSGSRESRRSDE